MAVATEHELIRLTREYLIASAIRGEVDRELKQAQGKYNAAVAVLQDSKGALQSSLERNGLRGSMLDEAFVYLEGKFFRVTSDKVEELKVEGLGGELK